MKIIQTAKAAHSRYKKPPSSAKDFKRAQSSLPYQRWPMSCDNSTLCQSVKPLYPARFTQCSNNKTSTVSDEITASQWQSWILSRKARNLAITGVCGFTQLGSSRWLFTKALQPSGQARAGSTSMCKSSPKVSLAAAWIGQSGEGGSSSYRSLSLVTTTREKSANLRKQEFITKPIPLHPVFTPKLLKFPLFSVKDLKCTRKFC